MAPDFIPDSIQIWNWEATWHPLGVSRLTCMADTLESHRPDLLCDNIERAWLRVMWTQGSGKNKPLLADTLAVLLPTPGQTLLLRACLLSGEAGRRAGETWLRQKQGLGALLQEEPVKA